MADLRSGPPPQWPLTVPRPSPSGQPRHGDPGPEAEAPRRTVPRHATGEWRTVPRARRKVRRADSNPWHWLLLLPIVVPLVPALYNHVEPRLLGLPFFYWGQLAFAFLSSSVIAFVHRRVR